jgi:hypothetical protein
MPDPTFISGRHIYPDPVTTTIAASRALRARVSRGFESMNLQELQAIGGLIRQMEDSLFRVGLNAANRRESSSLLNAEVRALKQEAMRVGTAIRLRAQEEGSNLVSEGGTLPSWWPWAAAAGGGVLVMWFLTKKGK